MSFVRHIHRTFNLTVWIACVSLLVTVSPAVASAKNGEKPRVKCNSIVTHDAEAVNGINQTLEAWRNAVSAGDARTLAGLVTRDAEFWTHGQIPLAGRDSVRGAFQSLFDQYDFDQSFECHELVLSGDWAFLRGLEKNRLTSRTTDDTTHVRQRAFSLMHRDADGVWRFARGMTNLPPEHE